MRLLAFLSILGVVVLNSCYSFKGISIPAGVNTYFVDQVQSTALNAPPDIQDLFMEQFREKVRTQTSLRWNTDTPDIEFAFTISRFAITNEGFSEGTEVSLNQLNISIKAEYINSLNEDESWKQNFSFSEPFSPDVDLQAVQSELIATIFEELSEQIFNKAFTNW